MKRLPLDLFAEVTTADGTRYKWDANQAPGSRLMNASFRTKIGEGFSDGGGQLARRIDLDYPDLNLVDSVTFTGADGSVAYEGRLAAMPRDLGDRHSIGVTLAGWMAHAKDRKFQEIYADRDLGSLGPAPQTRLANIAANSVSTGDFSFATQIGKTGAEITVALPNQALGTQTECETWAMYGIAIAKVAYRGKLTNWPGSWVTNQIAADDPAAAPDVNALTLDDTLRTVTLSTARQYVALTAYSNGSAVTPSAGALLQISKWATYGNHGLTLHTGETGEPDGVYASDVIRDIARRWCPLLDVSGVQDTTYVIQHLAFRDRTFPYDAFLEVNKYHLWNLAVWEDKRLCFQPYNLTDYDWEIRTDDKGTTFSPQGPSTENLFNGIGVTYTDALTGLVKVLTPETNPTELSDPSTSNPWNTHGIPRWDEITLSTPTLAPIALEIGRAGLADRNTPKTPGTITVRGYVRDRAGNEQPVWKMRAGQTIAITNFPNDAPRLIVETDYNDADKTIRLAIDRPFAVLEAYLDRQANALGARGLA